MAEGAWLSDVLAGVMLAVSLFCAGRLLLGIAWQRTTQRDVDAFHIVMGLCMAAMLVGRLTATWTQAATVAFVGAIAWFGWGVIRELSGRVITAVAGGHVPHLVASAAMVYMLVAMRWTGMTGGHAPRMAMVGMSTSGASLASVLVAALLVGDACLAAGSGIFARGRSRVIEQVAMAGGGGSTVLEGTASDPPGGGAPAALRGCHAPLAPRLTAACLVTMSLAMAYMFIGLRP